MDAEQFKSEVKKVANEVLSAATGCFPRYARNSSVRCRTTAWRSGDRGREALRSGYKRGGGPMTRQSFGAVWPDDKVAVYASERVAQEHVQELNAKRSEARESFGVRRSSLDDRRGLSLPCVRAGAFNRGAGTLLPPSTQTPINGPPKRSPAFVSAVTLGVTRSLVS
jgi:hypothetical protein